MTVFNCDSTASLTRTLSVARAGDEIRLAAGNYGEVRLTGMKFTGEVRVTSADPGTPAVISYLGLDNCEGLAFSNLEFNIRAGHLGAGLINSRNIRFEGVDVHGVLDTDPTTDGTGISIRDSTGVVIADCEFHDLGGGIGLLNARDLIVTGSRFHHIRSDGVSGTGANDVIIAGNHFSDFFPVGADHPDAIQLWTSAGRVTKNVMITDNVFERGSGRVIQGIFLKADDVNFENISITGNAIVGGMYQGISVEGAHGVTIADNLVLGYADMVSWIMLKSTTGASLYGNWSTSYITASGTDAHDNLSLTVRPIGDIGVLEDWLQRPASTTTTVLWGTDRPDTLMGRSNAEFLSGGAGADVMAGGGGDDVYVVDDAGDVVIELAGGGVDAIRSLVSQLTLSADQITREIENVALAGDGPQVAIGNALANVLIANAVRSTLDGGGGDDLLMSTGGHDVLTGGAGRDVFFFGAKPTQTAQITDFNVAEDHLDLRTLFPSYRGTAPVQDGWVAFGYDPSVGVRVYVDADGPLGPEVFQAIVDLTGLDVRALASAAWII